MTFHDRLRDLMKAKGLISTANKSGVDVRSLAKAAGTTYEMARRYVEGRAIPRADKLEKIAAWLGVSPSELLYGEPKTHDRIIHTEVLQTCIQAVRQAEQLGGRTMKPEQAAKLVALLYEEAIDGREISEGLLARLLRLM
jgi:transcriptional regulator with XRE-family HTH domain